MVMPNDEVETPAPGMNLAIREEAGKVPERAERYFEEMSDTLGPVVKVVAVVGAGIATVIGMLSILGGRK